MADSLITRCPKCSTAFRVSDEMLSMAKGNVRCGQCFHIFDAKKAANEQQATKPKPTQKPPLPKQTPNNQAAKSALLSNSFNDDDLLPADNTSEDPREAQRKAASSAYLERVQSQKAAISQASNTEDSSEELAPWEVELAEVEAALKAEAKKPKPMLEALVESKKAQLFPDEPTSNNTAEAPAPSKQPILEKSSVTKNSTALTATAETTESDPDYMQALQSLAKSPADEPAATPKKSQHTILEQLSAQESLAPLLEDDEPKAKSKHPLLWFFASMLALALLAGQVAMHFFEEGSRSAQFRSVYRVICAYSSCTLPGFEDVNAISIQHVRIQSHPSIKNTLLVNAIITNVSRYSQPMPKIALEFFDLNGSPVAARLFSPNAYLHKDFLDITYMPPNTPIHVVIPIQDPGARAVTHQLKAFPADTRSY